MEKDIMLHYISLVELLGLTLGPDYEIVLYDLRREDKSIIAIANGHVSGRTVGAPLTESSLKSIANKEYTNIDYKANYNSVSKNNKLLRSSSLYIKDGNNALVGLLCINFDDSSFVEITKNIMSLCHPNELINKNSFEKIENIITSDESDNIGTSVEDVTRHAIQSVLKNISVPLDRLTKEEKIEIVAQLNDRGIFMLKGAVPHVSKILHSSEATVYRYLSDLNNNK